MLEPRADSEVVIDAALELVRDGMLDARELRIVDVGTGSGCLLVTLLAELPHAVGVGIDLAPGALAVARRNAEANGVTERATFVEGDALRGAVGPFDLLVSNPPYIRRDAIAGLDISVRVHDPLLALDGGDDGLDIYRRVAADVCRAVPEGWLMFEVGAEMAGPVREEISALVPIGCLGNWRVWRDLTGHERCVAVRTLRKP